MVEISPENPNSLEPDPIPPQNPGFPEPEIAVPSPNSSIAVPAIRITSEFDSDSSEFHHKLSCRFFDKLAKIKVSFQNDKKGKFRNPQVGFITKYLSVLYDVEERNAFFRGSFDVGSRLQLIGTHELKGEPELTMVTSLADPSYTLQLSSPIPLKGLPRTTFKFPRGELQLEERDEEDRAALSISGILKGDLMNGVCTAQFRDEDLNLRYSYKDEEMTFIPSITFPSNALSFAFKRQFTPSDKLSYHYDFDSTHWYAVYKHTVGEDLKLKAGYDSEARFGWASLWMGSEKAGAKGAPLKTKVQVMLQVPQDSIEPWAVLFKVKKRWDI